MLGAGPDFYKAQAKRIKQRAQKENDDEGYNVHVRVEDADFEAYQVLHFWLLTKEIPESVRSDQMLMVRSWTVGEQYAVRDFINDVMFWLLVYFDNPEHVVTFEAVKYAYCQTQQDALDHANEEIAFLPSIRFLMAEQLVVSKVANSEKDLEEHSLTTCTVEHSTGDDCGLEELPHVLKLVAKAYGVTGLGDTPMMYKFNDGCDEGPAEWMYRMGGRKWRLILSYVNARIRVVVGHRVEQKVRPKPPGSVLTNYGKGFPHLTES